MNLRKVENQRQGFFFKYFQFIFQAIAVLFSISSFSQDCGAGSGGVARYVSKSDFDSRKSQILASESFLKVKTFRSRIRDIDCSSFASQRSKKRGMGQEITRINKEIKNIKNFSCKRGFDQRSASQCRDLFVNSPQFLKFKKAGVPFGAALASVNTKIEDLDSKITALDQKCSSTASGRGPKASTEQGSGSFRATSSTSGR